jgi:hypothetical protein
MEPPSPREIRMSSSRYVVSSQLDSWSCLGGLMGSLISGNCTHTINHSQFGKAPGLSIFLRPGDELRQCGQTRCAQLRSLQLGSQRAQAALV